MHTQLHSRRFVKLGARMMLVLALMATALIYGVLPAEAAPKVVSVSVGAQAGALTSGTAGSTTYIITVSKSNAGFGSNAITANLSVLSGLPAGATGSFSPATLSWAAADTTPKTSTLTINTSAAAAAGSSTFTVRAVRSTSSGDNAQGNGTLVINAPVAGAPTITFGAAPAATYPGANFTVSATSNSNGALSYSVVSGPCVVVNSNLGTFSPSGVGACAIQASTTATANFTAGSTTQSVTITTGAAGPASSCPCDLWAKTGTLALPGAPSINIYGYSATSGGAAGLPGPTLTVNQGEAVAITLHNVDLPSATSLIISGQAIVPDSTGVTAGSSKIYTIPAGVLQPGTYLYEAGLTADGPRQVAMGLYGALVVRPAGAPLQAYADPSTTFADQAVLVLSEIDPALNANPATFDMNSYAPKYWLINGKVYPGTDAISTAAGNKVLLRYLNAGLLHHSMGLLGLHQTILATNGKVVTSQSTVVAETIPAGSTLDTLVTVPASAPVNAKYALFEAAMHADNNGARVSTAANAQIVFGGMLTFLTVGGTTSPGDTVGPVTSNVALSTNPSNGSAAIALSANVSDVATGGSNVTAAEYFIDAIGANGGGTAMAGAFGSPTASVNATISVAALALLPSGNHTFYVHGQDSAGNWGVVNSVVLTLDKTGPAISDLSLSPSPTNGTADVQVQATASDAASGNQNVTAAEYTIDGGATAPMSANNIAASVSLTATIPAATVAALADGNHIISIHATDALGNVGAPSTITLVVDKTGPGASLVSTTPNPTNGTFGVQISSGGAFYQRIDATITDPIAGGVRSNIVTAEYFIDTVGANGTGGSMFATAGVYNGTTVTVYGAADLYGIAALTPGNHTIYVHGQDAAGNWGTTATTTLIIDKTAPTVSSVVINPNSPNIALAGATNVPLTATATDAVSAISAAEYYIDADPGVGLATPITTGLGPSPASLSVALNLTGLAAGNHTVGVRAKDAAGNWSAVTLITLSIQNALFANSFPNQASPYGWSGTGGTAGRLSLSNTAGNIRDAGTRSLQAAISGSTSGYVSHTITGGAATSYHARFYVNPNNVTLGTTTPTIFSAMNGTTTVFSVQMQRVGAQYQVRATGTTSTAWVNISGATAIEVARNGATLTLYVGGVSQGTVAVATTSITSERLGLQGALPTSSTNPLRLDAFVSTRTAYIGP